MADETSNEGSAPEGSAPTNTATDDDSVTLTAQQLKSIENSIWAKARRVYAKDGAPPDPAHEQRVARGLRLLEQYEGTQDRLAESDARLAPLWERAIGKGKQAPAPQPAAPAQNDQLGEFVKLMTLSLQQQMVDKMPKPAIRYEDPTAAVNASINASIADIPEDDPRRHERVQKAVSDHLSKVRVSPTGAPRVPTQTKK